MVAAARPDQGDLLKPHVIGHEVWLRVEELVKQLVAAVTAKEASSELDCGHTVLSDKLAERNRNRLAAEELIILLAFDTPLADEIIRVIAQSRRWALERPRTRTPEEELRDTRAWVQANAPALLPSLNKAMGREPPEGSQR